MTDPRRQEHVELLPDDYDEKAYFAFLELYGTHFVRSLQMGGAKHVSAEFESNAEVDVKEIQAKLGVRSFAGEKRKPSISISLAVICRSGPF